MSSCLFKTGILSVALTAAVCYGAPLRKWTNTEGRSFSGTIVDCDASTARWRFFDPAGYPDGANQHFYACVATYWLGMSGLWIVETTIIFSSTNTTHYHDGENIIDVYVNAQVRVNVTKKSTDGDAVITYDRIVQIGTGLTIQIV